MASEAVNSLRGNDIAINMSGQRRFEEDNADGVVGPVTDSPIDELMSGCEAYLNREKILGPAAQTVLVFEKRAAEVGIEQRVSPPRN